MAGKRITESDLKIILAYADCNMNAAQTAKVTYYRKESIYDHLDKIYLLTGLNPRKFYDLVKLVKKVKEGKLVAT